jgi:nicotinamidase-related amidase
MIFSPPLLPESKPEPEIVIDRHTALLLIDIQNFYFTNGKLPLVDSETASQKAGKVLEIFRENKLPVIHVKHEPVSKEQADKNLDSGWDFHRQVIPRIGEKIFVKHEVNSFLETGLYEYLKKLEIKMLIFCGMQTHMCLEAAVRAAADLGFSVVVIHDACATRDLEFGGIVVPARFVQASTLATLASAYARVTSSDFLITELKRQSE